MGATLNFGYYSAETDDGNEMDMGLTTIGASYEVMDGLTAHASYDMYDENGFWMPTSNVLGAGTGTDDLSWKKVRKCLLVLIITWVISHLVYDMYNLKAKKKMVLTSKKLWISVHLTHSMITHH